MQDGTLPCFDRAVCGQATTKFMAGSQEQFRVTGSGQNPKDRRRLACPILPMKRKSESRTGVSDMGQFQTKRPRA
jgi:hypothetical protein